MPEMTRPSGQWPLAARLHFIDTLKAVAAQFIVWHHFASYGPLATLTAPLFPQALFWLHEHARLAVHAFLAISGYLTARHLAQMETFGWQALGRELLRRYVRLGGPYLALLLLAIAANMLADRWSDHPVVAPPPTWPQVLAHVVFLQDLLGHPALSAGVWYVAIDFHLFLLALGIWLLAHAGAPRLGLAAEPLAQSLFTLLALAARFWFNLNPDYDTLAPYFCGSYFAGMVGYWAALRRAAWPMVAWVAAVVASEILAWRPRLVIATITACALLLAAERRRLQWPASRMFAYLGRTSFSLFLIHFPIYLLVSAWLDQWALSPVQAALGILLAWILSLLAADLLYRTVERPCLALAERLSWRRSRSVRG